MTPSERAFSSGGITAAPRRSSLTTDIFKALQILKHAYRNGHVSADDEAGKHYDALTIVFDSILEKPSEDLVIVDG